MTYTTTSYVLQTQTNLVSESTSIVSSQFSSAGNPLTNVPGFPIESILVSVILPVAFLVVKRSKKHSH